MSADAPSDGGIDRRVGSPARGYSWPPFEPGNGAAVKHGAYADLRLSTDPRVAEFVAFIFDTQPVAAPCDAGAVWRLALCYRRLELSATALDEADRASASSPVGAYADSAQWLGRLRGDHDRWLSRAASIEAELGRTPASRAKLGLDVALARRALTVVDLHQQAALEDALEDGP